MEKNDAVRAVVALMLVADWASNSGDDAQSVEWIDTAQRVADFFGVPAVEVGECVAKACGKGV